jgi:hypothetical protein
MKASRKQCGVSTYVDNPMMPDKKLDKNAFCMADWYSKREQCCVSMY